MRLLPPHVAEEGYTRSRFHSFHSYPQTDKPGYQQPSSDNAQNIQDFVLTCLHKGSTLFTG